MTLLEQPRILSVRHPWAYLIVHGIKDVENRGHEVAYRGPVLIQAGKTCPRRYVLETLEDLVDDGFLAPAACPTFEQLRATAGHIIGQVELVCVQQNPNSNRWSALEGWSWQLEHAKVLCRPIPYSAMLGLLRCPAEIARAVESIGFETGDAA
jgi:hypothetical protein